MIYFLLAGWVGVIVTTLVLAETVLKKSGSF